VCFPRKFVDLGILKTSRKFAFDKTSPKAVCNMSCISEGVLPILKQNLMQTLFSQIIHFKRLQNTLYTCSLNSFTYVTDVI
jgi:hypothetical protein